MKVKQRKRNLISIVVLGLMFMIAMPVTALGQRGDRGGNRGRGQNNEWSRDRNRDNRHIRRQRKCGKFVNCHDARDGRLDGRGPNHVRVNNRWRNRDRDRTLRNRRIFDRNGRRLVVRRNLR